MPTPADSYVVPYVFSNPPPTDVDIVRVRIRAGFQCPDDRFGPGAGERMYTWLEDSFFDDLNDDVLEDCPDADAVDEAYDCYEGDGRVFDALGCDEPAGSSGSAIPYASATEDARELPPMPGVRSSYGTESWESPSGTGPNPKPRQPTPVARGRLGLTALSQKYNVYFAAHRDKIHVYRPQKAPEILHGALLVLRPKPTDAAALVGGYLSKTAPHQVNHMIVGDLGDIEILLMAFDDGDVVAYYTHQIVAYLSSTRRGHPTLSPEKPKPFFRETVGMSAWGLAIHSASRLIAVSSNLAEVTVFAPALCHSPLRNTTKRGHPGGGRMHPHEHSSSFPKRIESASVSAEDIGTELQRRDRNWRILLPLGRGGTNIPSIAFADDDTGSAETVIATDIEGYVWFLPIWKIGRRPVRMRKGRAARQREMGWGILPIPRKRLLATNALPKRTQALLGRENEYMTHSLSYSLVTDITRDFEETPRQTLEELVHLEDLGELSDELIPGLPYSTKMLEELDCAPVHGGQLACESADDGLLGFESHSDIDEDDYKPGRDRKRLSPSRDRASEPVDLTSGFYKDLVACPSTSFSFTTPAVPELVNFLRISRTRHRLMCVTLDKFSTSRDMAHAESEAAAESATQQAEPGSPFEHPTDDDLDIESAMKRARECDEAIEGLRDIQRRYLLLQTLSSGAQMFSASDDTPIYEVDKVTWTETIDPYCSGELLDMSPAYNRCSMVHFIPEISLILVGQMQGQVALLRPLKNSTSWPPWGPEHRAQFAHANYSPWAFRTEWILPLAADDAQMDSRPRCCLLGIAVSRVPEQSAGQYGMEARTRHRRSKRTGRRKWRLILHYMDHSILQYYIEEGDPNSAGDDPLPVLRLVLHASAMQNDDDFEGAQDASSVWVDETPDA